MKKHREFLKEYSVLGLISLLACGGFLVISATSTGGLGFPLDDAWIHQTFARNLAEGFTWSFQMGQPSGGSTGPLWGLMLSFLHFGSIPEILGTHFLGFLILWACSIVGFQIGRILLPENGIAPLLIGAMISLEWHLVWAALSGMETILLVLISLLIFRWILEKRNDWWIPGILTGISVWVRPDGLTLVGPILLSLLFRRVSARKLLGYAGSYLGSLILVASPYFIFNHFVAGDFWPNTFYAKQTEYEILLQAGIISNYLKLARQAVTGIGIILLPGFVVEILDISRRKNWERAGILLWSAGYVGVYAFRLPVIYQHGRYIMPMIPAFILLGAAGLTRWIELKSEYKWKRIISAAWGGTAVAVLIVFWGLGAKAYALDVGVIESEMVQVARWVKENTPKDAVVGAHDIGGLGYFGDREIIDLAGLISPDVIPFIRDQKQLAAYLNKRGANFLVTFPSWYPEMVEDLALVYESDGEFSSLFGMDRMSVYLWK